ncbi:ankyrin repeat domain-containing protein [Streptomyces sp. NBU3104]|uniref:ankyrin repeat domain-containing protein n=1 Tax=Streptomyces sp. NBU3104 TaxID=2911367 RepID=UPI001EDBDC77|nr:ankyrin repeat domain-containing protein [Streptomyces sp. NBU3104]UKL05259.1 ankyrin repeat domain-containing protein [Streptomyces sp. NBU3104]
MGETHAEHGTDPTNAAAEELFSALYEADEDLVAALLGAGVSPEADDGGGGTALHSAAVDGRAAVVRLLLAAGADPDRRTAEGELPLCGAACWGRTAVVRALLAAGADPGGADEPGPTALVWAAQGGHAGATAALLEAGAEPVAGRGDPPLVRAARQGSLETVRVLLEHGADGREAALEEALRWSVGLAERLREELEGAGESAQAAGEVEVVVREVRRGSTTLLAAVVLRDGDPGESQERFTSHAAVATVLEEELGRTASYEELSARALRRGEPWHDDWREPVRVLGARGDEETYAAAAARLGEAADSPEALFAVEVLGRLGVGRLTPRVVPLLRELAREAVDAQLLAAAVRGLGHHGDPGALPELYEAAGHSSAEVREAAGRALFGLVPADDARGVAVLVALSADAWPRVREWAVTALAALASDTGEVREALAARLADEDPATAAEAAAGLVRRGAGARAEEALGLLLTTESEGSPVREKALETVEQLTDPAVRRRLEGVLPLG